MNNVLYITYDGINDPLGQSQIVPYIEGLAGKIVFFLLLALKKTEQVIITFYKRIYLCLG